MRHPAEQRDRCSHRAAAAQDRRGHGRPAHPHGARCWLRSPGRSRWGMKGWWPKRSLRLRLTLWYAATSLVILIALGALLLTLVRQRLVAELDRQLRSDLEFVAARLEHDDAGRIRLDYENEDKQDPERFAN